MLATVTVTGATVDVVIDDKKVTIAVSTQGVEVEVAAVSGITQLAQMSDISLDDVQDGDVITWNEALNKWVNLAPEDGGAATIVELTDTDITSPTDGQVLVYDSASSKWVNQDEYSYSHPSSHAIGFITGLQDALDAKVDDGQVLTDVPVDAVFTDTDTDTVYDDTAIQAEVDLNTAKVSNVDHPTVETAVPAGAVFTDTVYDDTAIQSEVDLNTAKVSDVAHPTVETAVPAGAVFTDTVYDDTEVVKRNGSVAMTGTLSVKDIEPISDAVQVLGSATKRLKEVHSNQLLNIIGIIPTVQAAALGGIISVVSQDVGASTITASHADGISGLIATTKTIAGSTSAITMAAKKAFAVVNTKSLKTGNDCIVNVTGSNSVTFASIVGDANYNGAVSTVVNDAEGSLVMGMVVNSYYAYPAYLGASSAAKGAFVQGSVNGGYDAATLKATAQGAFCQGFVYAAADIASIISSERGAFSQGFAYGGLGKSSTILSSGRGAFSQGYTQAGRLEATADGAFAQGVCYGKNIIASGAGSFAHGRAVGVNIKATAQNSAQFGLGTNDIQDSLQVGLGFNARSTGSWFCKEKAAPDADVVGWGQLWVKNTVPVELWWTDDAGTSTKII